MHQKDRSVHPPVPSSKILLFLEKVVVVNPYRVDSRKSSLKKNFIPQRPAEESHYIVKHELLVCVCCVPRGRVLVEAPPVPARPSIPTRAEDGRLDRRRW